MDAANFANEIVDADGLGDEAIHTHSQTSVTVAGHGVSRKGDDRDVTTAAAGALFLPDGSSRFMWKENPAKRE